MANIEQLITGENVLRVTQLLMDMDTAWIEERYQKMGVRTLLNEQAREAHLSMDTQHLPEELPFFPPFAIAQTENLKTFATQLANLLTVEAKQHLAHCLGHDAFNPREK